MSNNFIQMVNFPIRIPDCGSHSHALLDLFLSSDCIICSTVAFLVLGNFEDVIVSVSIHVPSNSKKMPLFIVQLITILLRIEMVFLII